MKNVTRAPRGWAARPAIVAAAVLVLACTMAALPAQQLYAGEPGGNQYQVVRGTVTHAAFFSAETNQPAQVDPQMFVQDPSAPAGTGPQAIAHVAGVRPARPASDPPASALYSADAVPLGVTLGAWLAASGQVTVSCQDGGGSVDARYQGLIPGGLYQLERVQFLPDGARRSVLAADAGDPAASAFRAHQDGGGSIDVALDFCPLLSGNEIIVLAYHSDAMLHGRDIGSFGHDVHNQLVSDLRQPGNGA